MAAALLLTLLGLAGVFAGILLGRSRLFSTYLAAAGGGLLFGISIFFLIPEIAAASGWLAASLMTTLVCALLVGVDRAFLHPHGTSREAVLAPVLAAVSVHSFIDGWSVRALQSMHVAGLTAPLGLALHKIPEGLAIGWVARHNSSSPWKAGFAAASVELLTLVGALLEPHADRSALALFGRWWSSAVVAVISGSFLFLGVHAIVPNRRRFSVMLVFTATLALVGTASLIETGNV